MPVSQTTRRNTRAAVVAAGTSVSASVPMPTNCHTVILLNRSASQIIIISQGAAGGALADNGLNAVIPPAATVTWTVGSISKRPDSMEDLIFDTVGVGAANCDLTYLCETGSQ